METIAKVRRRYHLNKESVSRIARKMNLSRTTVRKYVDYDGDVPKYPNRKERPKPQLGAFEETLKNFLFVGSDAGGERAASFYSIISLISAYPQEWVA
ncbi:MAG: hypothetical protein ACYCYL_04555 [Acidithiobacillus sp.]